MSAGVWYLNATLTVFNSDISFYFNFNLLGKLLIKLLQYFWKCLCEKATWFPWKKFKERTKDIILNKQKFMQTKLYYDTKKTSYWYVSDLSDEIHCFICSFCFSAYLLEQGKATGSMNLLWNTWSNSCLSLNLLL